jgi:sarcosine oxidase delta subunit
LAIVNDPKRRDRLVRKYGKNAENVAYGTAVNQVKKQAANNIEEPTTEEPMEDVKLKEMVKAALSNPKAADLNKDGELSNYEKKRGAAIEKSMAKKGVNEDLDLGHEDNEPHMIKSELYRIGKYAMELYKMVDQFEGEQEVDFPAWWQSKITTAKNMISSAKHYLEFELQEPQIDAMVGVASEEGAIDENIDDIDYRNRNNVMRGIYDLAEKSKDVESFKDKWYKTYSRGLQDKDADTDEWLETIFRRVNKSSKSIDEKLKPSMGAGAYVKDFRKSDAPQFDNKSKAKKDKMAVAAYLSAKDKTKKKIKEAILAKLKNK